MSPPHLKPFKASPGWNSAMAEYEKDPVASSEASDIDRAKIAVMVSGARIKIYPGEGADADCFAGELLNPTEREMRGNGHISCMWDRSKVVILEPSA